MSPYSLKFPSGFPSHLEYTLDALSALSWLQGSMWFGPCLIFFYFCSFTLLQPQLCPLYIVNTLIMPSSQGCSLCLHLSSPSTCITLYYFTHISIHTLLHPGFIFWSLNLKQHSSLWIPLCFLIFVITLIITWSYIFYLFMRLLSVFLMKFQLHENWDLVCLVC